MNDSNMTSNKPYLIRAMHEWIWDNDCTPYLYIDTQVAELQLPEHLFAENPLILNTSPNACKDLDLTNDAVSFQARFGGQVFDVYLPMDAIIAIVARENGQGMTFELSTFSDEAAPEAEKNRDEEQQPSKPSKKGGLKIIR